MKIVSDKNDKKFDIYRGRVDSNDLNEIIEDLKSINDATVCVNNITAIMKIQTQETNDKTEHLNLLIEKKSNNLDAEVTMLYKALAKSMNLTARRTETETELFSQLYSVGINAFEKIIIKLNALNLRFEDFGADVNAIKQVPGQIDFALIQFIGLRETVNNMPTKYPPLKEARGQYVEVLDLLIYELRDASEITKIIFEKIS